MKRESSSNGNACILIIGGNSSDADVLYSNLKQKGYEVLNDWNAESAIRRINENAPDLVVVGVNVADEDKRLIGGALRSSESPEEIPAIMYTRGEEAENDGRRPIECVDYIMPQDGMNAILRKIETYSKLHFMLKINQKLVVSNKILESRVAAQERQLEETIAALKEFNVMLEDEINERTKTEEALRESERQFRYALEEAPVPIMLHSEAGNVIKINNAWTSLTGYTINDIPDISMWEDKISTVGNEYHVRTKDGKTRIWDFYIAGIGRLPDENMMIMSVALDITERKLALREIIYLSYHDKLTGLYNRRFYEEEIKKLDNDKNLPITIVIGDVNGLKLINDAFGHQKGDELLKKAAGAIRNACRAKDIAARWGGDEFVILLPETGLEEAGEIINRIRNSYSKEYINAIKVSISFGWDTKVNAGQDILKILKNAEDHMYRHKIVENEGMRGNAIITILNTLHEKNPREEQHSKRVSDICQKIGRALGIPETEVSRLKVAGLLHDIGKIAIDENILNKPGMLSLTERNEINRHPDIGYRILSSSNDMSELAECVLAHHERWDGKGYPKGLKGEDIPQTARIIAIADSFDAMTSERPYRGALTEDEAVDEIRKNAGTQFDPSLAKVFIENVLGRPW